MALDPAFEGAGQKVGLEIWRIEFRNAIKNIVHRGFYDPVIMVTGGTSKKLQVVPQDKSTYGEFYSGDSYLILHTKKPPNSSRLEWNLHFWLGKETSQDEAGVAAYKTVELDEGMGGGPVQYREVQEHESRLFLSYFKNGISYLDGGIDSGFKKVERGVYQKRLMHVKGKRDVRVIQVQLTYRSLNKGDVFILDDGMAIYVWKGPNSSRMETMKAMEVARRIKDDERGGKASIKIIDNRWDSDESFFTALGDRGEIPDDEGDDMEFEKIAQRETALYRVSDESGDLEIEEVADKPLKRVHLESEDCFVLDSGPSGVYVWVGKKCTLNEKKQAWIHATNFLNAKGYPNWTQVTRVVEGGETPLFKQYFKDWSDPGAQVGLGKVTKAEKIASYREAKFDSTTMYEKKKDKEEMMVDDARGTVKIWRVENKDLVMQPEDTYGIFYTGDCYVLLYTYKKQLKENYIIYFWQGNKSTTDERGASAIHTTKMDGEMGGIATQIRVVEGREPEHFLRIFQGKMVVFLGGINNKEPESDVRIFQVRGTNNFNTRAAQVIPRASSLNSNDVFIIDTGGRQLILWCGKGASEEEKKTAIGMLHYLSPDSRSAGVRHVEEGAEPEEFWSMLGGKEAYATGPRLENNVNNVPPRLFQCSNASGRFDVEEIVDFCQEDICEDDVMILDTIDEVYVWLGKGANEIEKKMSLQTALDYIAHDPTGRNPDNTIILQIKQGFEPPGFTGHFLGWDPEKWSEGKTYEDLKRELGQENVRATTVQEELAVYDKKYPYSDLTKPTLPKGVDPCKKERYLTDTDFQDVFKMTFKQYSTMQQWKQIALKKKVGLF